MGRNDDVDNTQDASFLLCFKDLKVGYLSLKEGSWRFVYSDSFKAQDDIAPIREFKDINGVYKSDDLFPFFLQRIPDLDQPIVRRQIDKEHLNVKDEVELLKYFGQYSNKDPFVLTSLPK